ncbi:unnamed protein product [Discosporangium mesarthrocarpum]
MTNAVMSFATSPSVISCVRKSEKQKVPLASLGLALAHQAWKERVRHTRTSLNLERQGRRTRPHLELKGWAAPPQLCPERGEGGSHPDTGESVVGETAPAGWFPTSLLVLVLYGPFGPDDMELFSDRMSEGPSKSETSSVSRNVLNDSDGGETSNPSPMEKLGGRRKRPTGRAEWRETALDPSRRISENDSDSISNNLCPGAAGARALGTLGTPEGGVVRTVGTPGPRAVDTPDTVGAGMERY